MYLFCWNTFFLLIVVANIRCVFASTDLTRGADIVFLLDGSRTIGKDNFQKVKEWVVKTAEMCNISNDEIRIGVVEFSEFNFFGDEQEYISTQIEIGEFSNIEDFKTAVARIPYFAYTTDTAHGLQKALGDLEQSNRFKDPQIAKIIILITNGEITDKPFLGEILAKLYFEKVIPIVIGVGKTDEEGLRLIANRGVSDEHLSLISAFTTLDFSLTQTIVESIQEAELQLILPEFNNTAESSNAASTATKSSNAASTATKSNEKLSNATSNPIRTDSAKTHTLDQTAAKLHGGAVTLKNSKHLVAIALLLQATWSVV